MASKAMWLSENNEGISIDREEKGMKSWELVMLQYWEVRENRKNQLKETEE